MKKFFLALFLSLTLSSLKADGYKVPMDINGVSPAHISDVGVRVYLSTCHIPYIINGSSRVHPNDSIKSSSVAIYGVLTSTFSGTNTVPAFLEIRSTNMANTASELLVPPINIGLFLSTQAVGYPKNNLVIFDPPIIAPDGVSVNISSNVDAISTRYRYSAAIFYRYLSSSVDENYLNPTDDNGQATLGASFYGVKSGTGTAAGLGADDKAGAEAIDFASTEFGIYTSTIPSYQTEILLYGWCSSTGSANTRFDINRSTNGALSFLPPIYPRTFGIGNDTFYQNTGTDLGSAFTTYSFPWPLIVEQRAGTTGLTFQASVATERFRLFTRNRRSLRIPQ